MPGGKKGHMYLNKPTAKNKISTMLKMKVLKECLS